MLAVPIGRNGQAPGGPSSASLGPSHLDTICTVIDEDAVLMHPAAAYSLTAHTISPRPDGLRVSRAQPFLEAAAFAMGISRLRVIDSGTEPAWGQQGQWDDGSNVLAIGPSIVVSHERNWDTNARLETAGVQVIRVPSSELGSIRGGPRRMACAIARAPAGAAAAAAPTGSPAAEQAVATAERVLRGDAVMAAPISVPGSREATHSGAVPAVRADAVSGGSPRAAGDGSSASSVQTPGHTSSATARPPASN